MFAKQVADQLKYNGYRLIDPHKGDLLLHKPRCAQSKVKGCCDVKKV
jgi:hypothetical protein